MIAKSTDWCSKYGRNWRLPYKRFAGRDRRAGGAADQCQAGGVVEVDLEPRQIERLQCTRQFDVAVDLVIEVGVEMEPDIRARAASERLQLRDCCVDDVVVDIELGKARRVAGAGAVHVGLVAVEADQVGLEPFEALAPDLLTERHDVVERAHRVDPGPLPDAVGMAGAVGAAMRPVELQPVAHRPAEHLVCRHTQCLGLDVDKRILDRGDRHLVDPTGSLPCRGVEMGAVALDRPRVLADQKPLGEFLDDTRQALRAITFHIFRPADDPLVGGDFEKRVDPPAGVAVQVFDLYDFHRRFLEILAAGPTIARRQRGRSPRPAVRCRRPRRRRPRRRRCG